MFSDSLDFNYVVSKAQKRDPALQLSSRGIRTIRAVGGIPGSPIYEKLVVAQRDLSNDEDMEYIKSKVPKYFEDPTFNPLDGIDEFLTKTTSFTPFLYDTVIALGLAACNVAQTSTYFTGKELYNGIKQATFESASGRVVLNPQTGTREATSALFP